MVVKLARAQNQIESLQAVAADLDRRNKMMLGFFQKVLKPAVEEIVQTGQHACVLGTCEHPQAERWKCREALIELVKNNAASAQRMLDKPK